MNDNLTVSAAMTIAPLVDCHNAMQYAQDWPSCIQRYAYTVKLRS